MYYLRKYLCKKGCAMFNYNCCDVYELNSGDWAETDWEPVRSIPMAASRFGPFAFSRNFLNKSVWKSVETQEKKR